MSDKVVQLVPRRETPEERRRLMALGNVTPLTRHDWATMRAPHRQPFPVAMGVAILTGLMALAFLLIVLEKDRPVEVFKCNVQRTSCWWEAR